MKYPKLLALLLLLTLAQSSRAQKNLITDKEDRLIEQLRLFVENGLYQKAYDLSTVQLQLIDKSVERELDFETKHGLEYYHILAGLRIDAPQIIADVDRFLSDPYIPRYYYDRVCMDVADYYFVREEYNLAIPFLVQAGVVNLSIDELYKKRFQLGYSYFLKKDFDDAVTQFAAVKDDANPYQFDANYYFGLITFGQGRYNEALKSFRYIETYPKYQNVIPYYIAEIYYYNDDLDRCIAYAREYADQESVQYKENYHALLAQAYFEKKIYDSTITEFQLAKQYGFEMQANQNYTLGYAFYSENEVDSAISYFRPLSENEDSVGQNAMYLLADCYLQQNDIEAASKAFNYCKDLEYNQVIAENSHFNYIKAKYALGQYHEALRNIESFEKKYPNSRYQHEQNVIMGNIFLTTNNFEKGWEILAKDSMSSDPNVTVLLQKLALQNGKSKLNNNKPSDARNFLMYAINHPELPLVTQESKMWLSEAWARLGEYQLSKQYAKEYLENLSISNRKSVETNMARYNLSLAYLQLNKPDSCIYIAKSNIGNLGELDPYHIRALSAARIGDAYFMKNQYQEALQWYSQAKTAQVDNYYIQYQEAKINGLESTAQNQTSGLIAIADDDKNPYRLKANYDLADIYMDQRDYSKAVYRFNKCIEGDYRKASSLYKSGLSLEENNKYDDALNSYIIVIETYPNTEESTLAYNQVRQIYISQNRLDELEKFINSSGSSSATTSMLDSSTYYVAENYFIQEKYSEAIEAFQIYQTRYPEGAFAANACYYLATAYIKMDMTEDAISTYSDCTVLPSDEYYDNINLALADLYMRERHDTSAALKYFNNVIENSSNPLNQSDAVTNVLNISFDQSKGVRFNAAMGTLESLRARSNTVNINQYALHQAQSALLQNDYNTADVLLDSVKAKEISPYADEAYYLEGISLLQSGDLKEAERAMLTSINLNFVTDYWNLRYYLLLSRIFIAENDNFNAKATLNSLVDDSGNDEIIYRAQQILKEIN